MCSTGSLARFIRFSVLVCAVGAPVTLRGDEFDTSTLKPGDLVEVELFDEWKPGKVVEVTRTGWVWVVDQKKHRHLYTPDQIRLPAEVDSPFATEEEKSNKQVVRTWKDAGGKYEVQAKLLRVEGEQVVLERADGKQVTVALARLSDADRRFVLGPKTEQPSDNNTAPEASQLTNTNLDRARPADVSPGGQWQYVADVAETDKTLPSDVRIPLGKGRDIFDDPTALMLAPQSRQAFAVLLHSPPGKDVYTARMFACDLSEGKMERVSPFEGEMPIDISEDGQLLLARSTGFGFGKESRLALYTVAGEDVSPRLAWEPYADADEADRDVSWVRFVGSSHILTMSSEGLLALWNTTDLTPVWVAEGKRNSRLGLSANAHCVALAVEDGLVLLETLTGNKLGHLPVDLEGRHGELVALDTTGKQLALFTPGRCQVWQLDDQQLVRDFAVAQRVRGSKSLVWCGPEHLLVDGRALIDVTRRLWAWEYEDSTPLVRPSGEQVCFVTGGTKRDSFVLATASLPDAAARNATASLDADDLLVVRPGMGVSVDLKLDLPADERQKLLAGLAENLERSGLKADPQSGLKLICSIRDGETKEIEYREFGVFKSTTHKATEEILELSLEAEGTTVWKYVSTTSPPHFLSLEKNESIKKALQRVMKQDPSRIARIWLPGHVARGPLDKAYGSSPAPSGP